MEQIDLVDNEAPVNDAIIVENREKLMLLHGGAVTKITFDKVERMSLKTFVNKVVPVMTPDDGKFTVIRSAATGTYVFILGDDVFRYKVNTVEEAELMATLRLFGDGRTFDMKPNCPYPIVSYRSTCGGAYSVVCHIQSQMRLFKCSWLKTPIMMHLPPVWLKGEYEAGGKLKAAKVVVVPFWHSSDYLQNTLCRWPLANVYADGRVCLGGTEDNTSKDAGNIGNQMVSLAARVFDSAYNTDLMFSTDRQLAMIREAVEDPRAVDALKALTGKTSFNMSSTDMRECLTYTAVLLSVPGLWAKFNFVGAAVTAEEFCNGRRD